MTPSPNMPATRRSRVATERPKARSLAGGLTVALSAAAALTISSAGAAHADSVNSDSMVTSAETLTALQSVPGVLADSDTDKSTADADSAAVTNVGGTVVDVAKNPADGASMTSASGASLTVTPPVTGAATGTAVAPGVVAYPGTDGSSTAVQATENGGMRMLTVIANASAPTDYTYNVTVPGGSSVVVNADGTASVLGADGVAISDVQAPWATDANGASVPTRYTTDGTSLTQHISFDQGNYAFPIKADPWFWNYLACITGVGVPIGAAVVAVGYLGWEAIYVWATQRIIRLRPGAPPVVSTILRTYGNAVYNSCRRFIAS